MVVFDLWLKKFEYEIEYVGNYDEYEVVCLVYDVLFGVEEWKVEDVSDDYDYKLICKWV